MADGLWLLPAAIAGGEVIAADVSRLKLSAM
jgi:hypothetical protein